LVTSKKDFLFKVGRLSRALEQIERVMPGRADSGQAFVRQSPVPVFDSPPTTYDLPSTSFLFNNIPALNA
jgi:hypothetical protein